MIEKKIKIKINKTNMSGQENLLLGRKNGNVIPGQITTATNKTAFFVSVIKIKLTTK